MPHPRPNTTTQNTFTRPGSVTYTLPNPPFSTPYTTIALPIGSTWTSGLHWHEKHTEFLQVTQGAALVTLHNTTRIFTPEDGIITIPRYAKHEWKRADSAPELLSEGEVAEEVKGELVVREWTEPQDGQKEVFFRNLSSIIAHSVMARHASWYLTLQLWILFWELDNWPVLVRTSEIPVFGGVLGRLALGEVVEWGATHGVMGVAALGGMVFGMRGVREEFTPGREGGEVEGGEKEKGV